MSSINGEHKLVRYQNDNFVIKEKAKEPPTDAEKPSGCCGSKNGEEKPKARRKHSRQFTQHEIEYTKQLRLKDALKADKRKVHVLDDVTKGTDGKVMTVSMKKITAEKETSISTTKYRAEFGENG